MKPFVVKEKEINEIKYSLINDGTGEMFYVAMGIYNDMMIEPMRESAFYFENMANWINHVRCFHKIDHAYTNIPDSIITKFRKRLSKWIYNE